MFEWAGQQLENRSIETDIDTHVALLAWYIYINLYVYICVYIHECVYIYIHLSIYRSIYLCAYTHIYTPSNLGSRRLSVLSKQLQNRPIETKITRYRYTHLALLAWYLSVAPFNLGSNSLSGLGS